MAYARERYGKLLEGANRSFGSQILLQRPLAVSELLSSPVDDTAVGLLRSCLLYPQPILIEREMDLPSGGRLARVKGIKEVDIPTIKVLRARLRAAYESREASYEPSEAFIQLELLFLTQVLSAAECHFVDYILREAVPLSDAIQGWNRYRGDAVNHLLYAVESLPTRCVTGVREGAYVGGFGEKDLKGPSEIESKREQLERVREIYGATLGFICEREALFEAYPRDFRAMGVALLRSVRLLGGLIDGLSALRLPINLLCNENPAEGEASPNAIAEYDVRNVYVGLFQALESLEGQAKRVTRSVDSLKPPSVYSRLVLPSVAGILVIRALGQLVWENRGSIVRLMVEAKQTASSFFRDWILEPLQDIIKTIRHKDKQFAITSQASLDAEIRSLERMVLAFAAKRNPEVHLGQVRGWVQQGDLGAVLEAYEASIQSPLSSTLFGDLVQTLLIQAQKAKVDASMALSALDSLLKSNELTFGLIAVIPPMLLAWGGCHLLHLWWQAHLGKSHSQVDRKVWLTISHIFRILNSQIKDGVSHLDRHTNLGFLICEVHYLRQLIGTISLSSHDDRAALLEAIRDLESAALTPQQRLNIIQLISTLYPLALKS
ncbi:Intraflagellar transport protein 88 [Massospora cicadina]|nr:Intraflagellar transport protein 88 [Massospora cicadina]